MVVSGGAHTFPESQSCSAPKTRMAEKPPCAAPSMATTFFAASLSVGPISSVESYESISRPAKRMQMAAEVMCTAAQMSSMMEMLDLRMPGPYGTNSSTQPGLSKQGTRQPAQHRPAM